MSNEKNKNDDFTLFNKVLFSSKKIKRETNKQKKERINIRLLTIINSIQKNIMAIKKQKKRTGL
jgi:hypothetical protein